MTRDQLELLLKVRQRAISFPRGRTPSTHVHVRIWRDAGEEPEAHAFEKHAPAVDLIQEAMQEGAAGIEVRVLYWDWDRKVHAEDPHLGIWRWP